MMEWGKLLEELAGYAQLPSSALEADHVVYSTMLYERINEAGFILSDPEIDRWEHAYSLQMVIVAMFAIYMDEPVKLLRDELQVDKNGTILDEMTTLTIPVKTIWRRGDHAIYDLGDSGVDGIMFVMKFLMAAEQIEKVMVCKQCGKLFFPKRSTAKYCSDKCRVAFNRRK